MNPPNSTASSQLACLFSPSDDPQALWNPHELKAIWQHQLAAAVEFDLGGLSEPLAAQLRSLPTSGGSAGKTFADLLFHSAPPPALLELVKEFAKAHSTHPGSLLPREISMALYYAAIAAALVRCSRRISSLTDGTLREGLQQVSRFAWLDEQTRSLIQGALRLGTLGTDSD